MQNPRITAKERGLIKGAIRRVFSRSELRRRVLEEHTIVHSDSKRPRVSKWSYCTVCGEVLPRYLLDVDHDDPIVPLSTTLEQMSWDTVIDRIWCEEHNLRPICKEDHKRKTRAENKLRPKKARTKK